MAQSSLFQLHSRSLNGATEADITEFAARLSWGGSYRDCARTLTYDLLPEALGELGGWVRLYSGGKTLFSGSVFLRRRSSLDHTMGITAYDRGIYLKRNKTYIKVRGQTPETVTNRLCEEFGISIGNLANTGVKLNRNFLGVSLYQVIQTMYTLAAEQTGEKYQIRFHGDALDVMPKRQSEETIRLVPGANLLSCDSSDSREKLVTSVAVYDDEAHQVAAYDSPDGLRTLYGLMQEAIRASDSDNPAQTARQLMADNGIKTTITARCLGNPKLICGNAVVVNEPATGTNGLFWILSDNHKVNRGIYETTVTLDFRNLMDNQSAGSVPTE